MLRCNACGLRINLLNPRGHDIIACPECGVNLYIYDNMLTVLTLEPAEKITGR